MSKEIQCKCCKEYWWEMNIHSTSGLCPNCYDYVADLEAKLAESENKVKKAYKEGLLQKQFDKDMEIEQLKQQLAEKEKKQERTNKVVKQFQQRLKYCQEQDQDKIAFAVEQLEKVKEDVLHDISIGIQREWISNKIDNQIKQLKEMK